MPVDPTIQAAMESMPPLVAEGATVEEIRAAYRVQTAKAPRDEVGAVEDRRIDNGVRVRIYRPKTAGPHPTVVYFHGGGWVFGDLETHDSPCRTLCADVDAVVMSVAYRLAPEHPFPAGVEDAVAATRWAGEHIDELGGDPERLAVAGDSAGGNLAAVVSGQLLDSGPKIAVQGLFYATTDLSRKYPSGPKYADGYVLDRRALKLFGRAYAPDPMDPRASPLLFEKLAELPPALVVTVEYDPLRDQGTAYADALRTAGVRVEQLHVDGMIHGFLTMGDIPVARRATDRSFALLKDML
ncbi:alpha/beta hydrolase [Fodinicola acaciae]|uniref:alpha/beta hydrolase n=1 Tax=Fodinicola acaciae TaxID=2681555 RepID=UPI0013D4A0A7|nr:alpha/beta hydrolase [Fodinicola acaciae]